MRHLNYYVDSDREVEAARDRFKRWIQVYGGIDVYYSQDLGTPGRKFFVPKGDGCPHWSAETYPRDTVLYLDEITIKLNQKVIKGIVRGVDGSITDINPDLADPDDLPVDLRRLTRSEAMKLDADLIDFFIAKGTEQGRNARKGDGGCDSPWVKSLLYGGLAMSLDTMTRDIPGMSGEYQGTLWEAFEDNLPDGLSVIGDAGRMDWMIMETVGTCENCGELITKIDAEEGVCQACGVDLKYEANDADVLHADRKD